MFPCRKHDVTISAFLAPQILLMSIPVVGPIVFIPMQAASAWLVDLLVKQPDSEFQSTQSGQGQGAGSNQIPAGAQRTAFFPGRNSAAKLGAPTVPASPPTPAGQDTYQQPAYDGQAGYQQSAYPGQNSYQQPSFANKYN